MCGRYTLRTPWRRLADHFGIPIKHVPELFVPRFNISPTQQVVAVRQGDDGREAAVLKWNFTPSWSKHGKIAPINAMSETAAEKPMFRSAIKIRRCLLPADGFYEWVKKGKAKQPHHFHLKSGEPFGLAGIWEAWGKDDDRIETVAILTTEANDLVRQAHTRMPVIVQPNDYDEWLDPEMQDATSLQHILSSFPADEMQADAVSDYVNNSRHEGEQCLAPAE
jgi:putative SOS response-associated peptidase YedK